VSSPKGTFQAFLTRGLPISSPEGYSPALLTQAPLKFTYTFSPPSLYDPGYTRKFTHWYSPTLFLTQATGEFTYRYSPTPFLTLAPREFTFTFSTLHYSNPGYQGVHLHVLPTIPSWPTLPGSSLTSTHAIPSWSRLYQ
jgi:hypothetical protein